MLLLHANETVSSDRLIDELWGLEPPARAAKLLSTYVWQLRKALGDTIVTRPPGYAAVVAPEALTLPASERLLARAQGEEPAAAAATLREALELWRGRALADVAFESSARDDVARLEDERLRALGAAHRPRARTRPPRGRHRRAERAGRRRIRSASGTARS